VATLIITCPCALGLAVPAVSVAASGRLFRRGLLLKSPTALERLAEATHVVFDKTGTLTEGKPRLDALPGDAEAASVALALAQGSAHPLARALAEAAQAAGVRPARVADLAEVPGHGVEGTWQGRRVRLGRAAWTGGDDTGCTATWLALPDRVVPFTFTDRLRPGAAEAVDGLVALGLTVELLSGDAPGAVAATAAEAGLETWRAGLLPQEKAARVAALERGGAKVLMIGDGLNDTAALAQAFVSISPASGLEAARAVADVVLMGASLKALPEAVRTARKARRRILGNFAIAAVYNIVSVPLAVAGLASPLAAALAMSTSSILVSLNALRVR
jgi:Cu2+-exporting ATPase